MNEKMDYQLNWVIGNKASYSKEEVKAARDELKRRSKAPAEKLKMEGGFEKYWNSLKGFFGIN